MVNIITMITIMIMNIRSEQKKCWLVLGLVWQLIRMHLFRQININEVTVMMFLIRIAFSTQVPGLVSLLQEGETLADLMKLGPEEILLRWVNYQLEKVGKAQNTNPDLFTTFPKTGRLTAESKESVRGHQGQRDLH